MCEQQRPDTAVRCFGRLKHFPVFRFGEVCQSRSGNFYTFATAPHPGNHQLHRSSYIWMVFQRRHLNGVTGMKNRFESAQPDAATSGRDYLLFENRFTFALLITPVQSINQDDANAASSSRRDANADRDDDSRVSEPHMSRCSSSWTWATLTFTAAYVFALSPVVCGHVGTCCKNALMQLV